MTFRDLLEMLLVMPETQLNQRLMINQSDDYIGHPRIIPASECDITNPDDIEDIDNQMVLEIGQAKG